MRVRHPPARPLRRRVAAGMGMGRKAPVVNSVEVIGLWLSFPNNNIYTLHQSTFWTQIAQRKVLGKGALGSDPQLARGNARGLPPPVHTHDRLPSSPWCFFAHMHVCEAQRM